jgi:hypothetical protein
VGTNDVVFDPAHDPLPLFFHTSRRDEAACTDPLCHNGATEPPRLWEDDLSRSYGHWIDFAMYIKPSTAPDYTDGRVRFFVNGNEVINSPWDGRNFYVPNPNYGNLPFYHVTQGYYRKNRLIGGVHVYMTPMLVTTPQPTGAR